MRKFLIISGVLVIVAAIVGARVTAHRDAAVEVTWAQVENRPITMTVETTGTVEPLARVEVGCEVTGKIIELVVDHDQPVAKGQVIARIDPELSRAEHEQSKADHLKALSALEDAKLAHEDARANLPVRTQQALGQKEEAEAALIDAEFSWRRVDELYKNENAPEAEWVGMKARWKRAEAMLITAKASHQLAVNNEKIMVERAAQAVAQAEAALQLAAARMGFTATRVDRCVIRSPIDGVVLRRYMDVGQTVNATFQTPILYLLSPALTTMRVSAKVGESDISHIDVDQQARFSIEAKQSVSFAGKILHKRSQPDVINNVVTYTVVVSVDNSQNKLLPYLTANVQFEVGERAEPFVAEDTEQFLANQLAREPAPFAVTERHAVRRLHDLPATVLDL